MAIAHGLEKSGIWQHNLLDTLWGERLRQHDRFLCVVLNRLNINDIVDAKVSYFHLLLIQFYAIKAHNLHAA